MHQRLRELDHFCKRGTHSAIQTKTKQQIPTVEIEATIAREHKMMVMHSVNLILMVKYPTALPALVGLFQSTVGLMARNVIEATLGSENRTQEEVTRGSVPQVYTLFKEVTIHVRQAL